MPTVQSAARRRQRRSAVGKPYTSSIAQSILRTSSNIRATLAVRPGYRMSGREPSLNGARRTNRAAATSNDASLHSPGSTSMSPTQWRPLVSNYTLAPASHSSKLGPASVAPGLGSAAPSE